MGLGLKKNPRFHQGYYIPKYPDKYIGREAPIFRSSIEKRFFAFCDLNEKVLKWSSEDIIVPYYDTVTKKMRKYYVDNYVEIQEGTTTKKYLIEIKPLKDTIEPQKKKGKRKATLLYEQVTYITNTCKWKSAIEFCKNNKLEFLVLGFTEKNGFEAVPLKL